jgi:hypothetical protein
MPMKMGIHSVLIAHSIQSVWIPAYAGMTAGEETYSKLRAFTRR